MTAMSCFDATHALGGYLVGAIDAQERAEVDAHLAHCPACRDELASLAALPGLMSRLTVDEVLAEPPTPDSALLGRLLAAGARERRVARHRRLLTAAAAAIFAAGATTAGVAGYHAATAQHWPAVTAVQGSVHMTVQMAKAPNGTFLTLRLSGVPPEKHCRLLAVSDTGTREVAGSWAATYAGTAVMKGTTGITYKHLSQLVIETDSGQELVAANV